MPAALSQLIAVRSQLAQGLMVYLRGLQDLPNQAAPPYFARRRPTDIYVSPDLLKKKTRSRLDDGRSRQKAVGSLAEEEQEQERFWCGEMRNRVPWEREMRNVHRGVILGRPGEGKTLLVLMTLRTLAEASCRELEKQQKGMNDVLIPVCVRLADVAEKGSVEAAIESAVQTTLKSSQLGEGDPLAVEPTVRHIMTALHTDRCWLLLDALDEVPERKRLKAALESLRNARCRVLVTSRPYGYDSTVLPFPSVIEYELAPLTPRQRRQFIGKWYKNDTSSRRARVDELLKDNPQFGDLTRNALLLTLTCATAERHALSPDTARRVDLYRLILRDMVRGVWKENPRSDGDPHVSLLVLVLEQVAWELFRSNPARNLFPDVEVIAKVIRASSDLRLQWDTGSVLKDLRATGLLVSPASAQQMFLHRTFLEYLSAEHVAKQRNPLVEIEPFLWLRSKDGVLRWQPATAEMICFLAGALQDPNPLLSHLLQRDAEQRDQFRTMLLLAGRALGQADPLRVTNSIGRTIGTSVVGIWLEVIRVSTRWQDPKLFSSLSNPFSIKILLKDMRPSRPLFGEVLRALQVIAPARIIDPLIALVTRTRTTASCEPVIEALARIGDSRAVEPLLKLVTRKAPRIRSAVATALGEIGAIEAVDSLLKALADQDDDVRQAATNALGKIQDRRAVRPLIAALLDRNRTVREQAARALGQIGDERAVEPLIEILMTDDSDAFVRAEIVKSDKEFLIESAKEDGSFLGETEAHRQAEAMFEEQMLNNVEFLDETRIEYWYLPNAAAESLSIIYSPRTFEILVQLLSDARWWVRANAVSALGQMQDERAVKPLIEALEDVNWYVRDYAAWSFERIQSSEAVGPLMERLEDVGEHDEVRSMAASALCQFGDKRIAGRLVELVLAGQDVRRNACTLRHIVDESVTAQLLKGLRSRIRDVRYWAADILGYLAGQELLKPLCAALATEPDNDDDDGLFNPVTSIAQALGRIGGASAAEALIEALKTRKCGRGAIADALGATGNAKAVRPLAEVLEQPGTGARRHAARALRLIPTQESVAALVECGKRNRYDDVRTSAIEGLFEISTRTGQWIPCVSHV